MKRFFIKILCFILIFLFISNAFSVSTHAESEPWPAYPEIFAQAGVLIEASTGTILYDKNAKDKMYPASITKILTSLIALENSKLEDMVTFSHDAVYSLEIGDANCGMKEGEMITMDATLHAVLLASANEAANAVAEHVGGSIDGFADMMNKRAKDAGAISSNFANPSGLFDENHYTTPYDMAMITRDAIKSQKFLDIEKATSYIIDTTNITDETRYISNRHKMLYPNNNVYYDGILGGKTGYVNESGNTLVTFAKRGNMTLISVVMKSDTYNVYSDTAALLDYGYNNFKLVNVSENEPAFSFVDLAYNSSYPSVFNDKIPDLTLDNLAMAVLPITANFSDLEQNILFNENPQDNVHGTIQYKYNDALVGSAAIKEKGTSTVISSLTPYIVNKEADSGKQWSIDINMWVLLALAIIFFIILFAIRYSKVNSTRKNKRRYNKRRNSY